MAGLRPDAADNQIISVALALNRAGQRVPWIELYNAGTNTIEKFDSTTGADLGVFESRRCPGATELPFHAPTRLAAGRAGARDSLPGLPRDVIALVARQNPSQTH